MFAGAEAWNSEFCFLNADIAGTGLLPVEAESQGKVVITTEMGGSENVTAEVHRLTQSGLRNVLVQTGALDELILFVFDAQRLAAYRLGRKLEGACEEPLFE